MLEEISKNEEMKTFGDEMDEDENENEDEHEDEDRALMDEVKRFVYIVWPEKLSDKVLNQLSKYYPSKYFNL